MMRDRLYLSPPKYISQLHSEGAYLFTYLPRVWDLWRVRVAPELPCDLLGLGVRPRFAAPCCLRVVLDRLGPWALAGLLTVVGAPEFDCGGLDTVALGCLLTVVDAPVGTCD